MSITVTTSITDEELGRLRDAFHDGNFIGVIGEHEGMTHTLLFEVPEGHIGLTIGTMPPDGDVYLSVSPWEKEPHHELDEWVWVRAASEGGGSDGG